MTMRNPRISLLLLAATLALPARVAAQEDGDKAPKAAGIDPAKEEAAKEKLAAIRKGYEEELQAFYGLFHEGLSQEEHQKLFTEKFPKPTKAVRQVLELVEPIEGSRTALDGLAWALGQDGDRELQQGILARLVSRYVEVEGIGDVCVGLLYSDIDDASRLLDAVAEKNRDPEARGKAVYVRARRLLQEADTIRRLRGLDPKGEEMKNFTFYAGEQKVRALLDRDPEALAAKAEKDLDLVVQKFGEIAMNGQTLGRAAAGELFELRNLAVGKVAPEITGDDLDGVPFKLSDYRGKVVVLDFWGYW